MQSKPSTATKLSSKAHLRILKHLRILHKVHIVDVAIHYQRNLDGDAWMGGASDRSAGAQLLLHVRKLHTQLSTNKKSAVRQSALQHVYEEYNVLQRFFDALGLQVRL